MTDVHELTTDDMETSDESIAAGNGVLGQRLLRKENTVDIDYCAQLDILDIVPIQQSPGILVWK